MARLESPLKKQNRITTLSVFAKGKLIMPSPSLRNTIIKGVEWSFTDSIISPLSGPATSPLINLQY